MRALLLISLLLLLVGCGYHFPGKTGALPGDVKQLYIPLFANRTAKPQLENKLSNQVSIVFGRSPKVNLVERESQAEAVLEGTIRSYSTKALSYDKNDDISEYRAIMTIDAKLRQIKDGRLLWSGTLSWDENYIAADDKGKQYDLAGEAVDEIVQRLSEELLSRLLDDF